MLIDWFTVCAQALNFLVLVWLMKRFLYKPVLNAIDTREKMVAAELADAAAKRAEAQSEHDEFQQKNEQFEKDHASMLSKANDDVKIERARLLAEAQQAANDLSALRRDSLTKEASALIVAIRSETQREVFAIARKTLSDLASTSLEESMTDVFLLRLKSMDAKAKEEVTRALGSSPDSALVRSTFELGEKQRAQLQDGLNVAFSAAINLRFETAPEQIAGIEFTAVGQRLDWSISGYLQSLETATSELVNAKAKPEIKSPPSRSPSDSTPSDQSKNGKMRDTATR
jgi:F-type H+-transporting ATPase subunit b